MPVPYEQKPAGGFYPRSGQGSSSCRTPGVATTTGAGLWRSRGISNALLFRGIPGKMSCQADTLPGFISVS
jgi:hypothetical protein